MNEILLILGMFLVTYSVRLLPFALAERLNFPYWLQNALSFVPVAALTAIIAPIIMYDDQGNFSPGLSNDQLVASVIAFAVAYKTKHLLLTVVAGLAAFFLLRTCIFG